MKKFQISLTPFWPDDWGCLLVSGQNRRAQAYKIWSNWETIKSPIVWDFPLRHKGIKCLGSEGHSIGSSNRCIVSFRFLNPIDPVVFSLYQVHMLRDYVCTPGDDIDQILEENNLLTPAEDPLVDQKEI